MVAGLLPLPKICWVRWPLFEPQVLDVRGTRLTHAQTVEAEQHGERGVVAVVMLRGEQEHPELGAVQATSVGMYLWAAHILRRVRRDATVDVREAVEAAEVDRRRSIVDAARPRSSIQLRYNSMCGRVAANTARLLSEAHWKKPRRSWRYASNVLPL